MIRSGSRWVCTSSASGYSASRACEVPDVARRLHHPAGRRVARLQVLEEGAVPAVGGGHVGLVEQPAGVARHPVLRREDEAAEVEPGDAHALLRQPGAHRVHGPEPGQHEVDARHGGLHLVDAGIGEVGGGLGRRAGPVDLPGEGHAGGRVLREEVEEDRGAGAALPDDDDRRDDGRVGDLRAHPPLLDHAQPAGQVRHDLALGDHHADLVQRGLGVERVRELVERLPPRVATEVREAGRLHRLVDEDLRLELSHGRRPPSRPWPPAARPRPRAGRSARRPSRTAGHRCRSSWARPDPRGR